MKNIFTGAGPQVFPLPPGELAVVIVIAIKCIRGCGNVKHVSFILFFIKQDKDFHGRIQQEESLDGV